MTAMICRQSTRDEPREEAMLDPMRPEQPKLQPPAAQTFNPGGLQLLFALLNSRPSHRVAS